jgi:predicted permease
MKWLHWIRREHRERELEEEIELDFALEVQQRMEAGATREEAESAARRDFGNVTRVKETTREMWGWSSFERLQQDLRYTFRRLRKTPAFTITTILTLALGIGATTSIFTLIYAVLLRSLAVTNPGELYRLGKEARCCYIGGYSQEKGFSLVSYDLYQYLQENAKGFSELAAFSSVEPSFGVRRLGRPEASEGYPGEYVSGNYFRMFGLTAYAGRVFTLADDQPNAPPVAVMSYRLWQQRYGSDPSVIGGVFDLDQKPFTVIGIAPPTFFGDQLRDHPPDFYLPLNTEPLVEADADLRKKDLHWLNVIGRLQPGAKPESVAAEMRVELKQWLRSHWGEMSPEDRAKLPEQTLFLSPGGAGITSMREQYEHWLHILMMVTGFVLLIVCANVANLLLVRGLERRRQVSLSMALGAQAFRLVREALTESILLALLGGATGLAIASACTRVIVHFAFPPVSGLGEIPINASPSIAVLLFAFVVSLVTGLIFGVGPAWMATRVDPIEALRGTSRAMTPTNLLPRKTFLVVQAALSLVLLSAAGLLTLVLHNLQNQNLGFDEHHRVVLSVEPRLAGYGYTQLTPLYRRIRDSLSAIPGVAGVALATYSPQNTPFWGGLVWVDGHPASGSNETNLAFWDRVTAEYFATIGNPIIRGRGISEQDTTGSRHVAVINESFARKYFANEDPIGRHFGREGIGSETQYEIVGVAKNIRNLTGALDKPADPFYFLPEDQHDFSPEAPSGEVSPGSHFLHDIVVAVKPGVSLSDTQLRRAMAAVDPNLPILFIRTLKEEISSQFTQQRLTARLTSLFGMLSLVLCCIGLYGVTAYNVGRRTSEIGIRMALGANRRDVITLVLRGAFGLILAGLLIGLPLTFAVSRFLGHQLYGMAPYNPVVMLLAASVLGVCALFASLIPALRASWVSPLEALRVE